MSEQSSEHSAEQSAEQSTDQSAEQSAEQSTEQSAEQSTEQSAEQSTEQSAEQSIEQSAEQSVEQSAEQISFSADDNNNMNSEENTGSVMDFAELSGRYFIASKGGVYEIFLEKDGTFTAAYHVDNPFASELTVIRSGFKGVFSSPAIIDDHTYSFTIESGESTYGNEKINEGGIIYDCKESDIKVGSEFRIYTRSAPDSSLPLTFVDIRDSVQNGTTTYVYDPDYSYLLYDVSNDITYCSEN